MKNFKKILALLIAIIMVIPAIPTVVSAETVTKSVTELLENKQYVDNLGAWLVSVRDNTVAPKEEATDDAPAYGYTYNLTTRDDLIYFMLCGKVAADSKIDVEAASFLNCTFKLKNDITLNYGTATESGFVPDTTKQGDVIYLWDPFAVGFRGTFHGNSNTIYGMVIESTTENTGMFKSLGANAYFNGLYFEDAYVNGAKYVGVLAGRNTSGASGRQGMASIRVTDSVVKGTMYTGTLLGGSTTAKLLFQSIVLTNCSVSSTGTCLGGIVGVSSKGADFEKYIQIINCTVAGAKDYVGGLIGKVQVNVTAENVVVNATTVSTTGSKENGSFIGGLVGGMPNGEATVENAKIDVTVSGARYVGGAIGEAQGNVTLDGISADVTVTAGLAAGGLYGRPGADVTTAQTISISNSFVDGTVTATSYIAGGFIAATGKHTANISNSICAANVKVTRTANTDVRGAAGGFIGVAEATTTMTNCQFLGVSESTLPAFAAAFAVVSDISGDANPTVTPTAPASNYVATFTDCYFASGSAERAICTYNNKGQNNWFDVTVEYTGSKPVTVALPSIYEAGTTGQGATGDIVSESVKTVYINGHSGEDSAILGAQMGSDNNARIIASVAADKDIINVEFDVITLGEYMAKTPESETDYLGSYNNSTQVNCTYAYKTIKDNYGLGEITADEGKYLVALVINGVNAPVATTILVRTVYYTPTKTYGQYMAVTFYNGDILGVSYVG